MYEMILKAQVQAVLFARDRLRKLRDEESGEILPWVLLTLGLLGVVALVVGAINKWGDDKTKAITSH